MTKIETKYLKGWAVLFMVFVHFGGNIVMPEFQYSWSGNDWSYAFQICVPIFLFLSGYGLMSRAKNKNVSGMPSFKEELQRAFKLLKHYWIVVTPFVVVALLTGRFTWSWDSLVLTATSLHCVWCPNAWFISLYIELILMFPIFFWCIKGKSIKWNVGMFLTVIVVTKFLVTIEWCDIEENIFANQVIMFLRDMLPFIEGMLFANYSLMEIFKEKLFPSSNCKKLIVGGFCVVVAIACRAKVPWISITELIHVPICLIGLLMLTSCRSWILRTMTYVSKYSITLWLIHGYFCWTFFQPLIYSIRFWPLAFFVFLIMSLSASILIDKARERILKKYISIY